MTIRRSLGLAAACALLVTAVADNARADGFIDRPIAVGSFHARFAAGIGFGQARELPTATSPGGGSLKSVWGSSLEGAVGLPFVGEIGLRAAYRFSEEAVLGGGDRFARPFDQLTYTTGPDQFSNPEISLTPFSFDAKVAAVGGQLRVVPAIAKGSDWVLTAGVPVRFRVPSVLRIDTGIYGTYVGTSDANYYLTIPIQAFFKIGPVYAGPLSGVRYVKNDAAKENEASVVAGFGLAYSLGPVDFMFQTYTSRINDSDWSQKVGAGIGAEIRVP